MIQLCYFSPKDRSGRARWLLHELGVEFEDRKIGFKSPERDQPAYRALHPLGKVPALVEGGTRIFESGAICLWLTERFPEGGLAPAPGDPLRGDFLKWLFFACTTLDPVAVRFVGDALPEPFAEAERKSLLGKDFAPLATALEAALGESEYLVGGRFSGADVPVAQCLRWVERGGGLAGFPRLQAYLDRAKARPAAQKAGLFA